MQSALLWGVIALFAVAFWAWRKVSDKILAWNTKLRDFFEGYQLLEERPAPPTEEDMREQYKLLPGEISRLTAAWERYQTALKPPYEKNPVRKNWFFPAKGIPASAEDIFRGAYGPLQQSWVDYKKLRKELLKGK